MLTGGIGRVSPGHLGPLVVSGAPGAAAKTDRPAAMAVGKSISHKKKPTMQESSGYDDHRQKLDQDIGPQIANPGFLCKIPIQHEQNPDNRKGNPRHRAQPWGNKRYGDNRMRRHGGNHYGVSVLNQGFIAWRQVANAGTHDGQRHTDKQNGIDLTILKQ